MGKTWREQPYRAVRLSPKRTAWVKVFNMELVRYDKDSGGVALSIRVPGRKTPILWNLEALTYEELNAVRTFLNDALDKVEPNIRQSDKEAQDALDNGDDSHPRVYRAAPLVVDRTRGFGPHGQGLQQRPKPVPGGAKGVHGPTDDAGGDQHEHDDLVERGPQDVERQDDAAPMHGAEVVAEVGRPAAPA